MELKTVRATKDRGIIKGATGPHILECDDGKTYLVKFAGPTKAAVNELVGQRLATTLGLPVPDAAFVEVSSDLVAASVDMRAREIRPGVHFGSELLKDVMDIGQFGRLPPETKAKLRNPEALPRTICLDNWISVPDRARDDNHLVEAQGGTFRYVLIDFSHAFTGVAWTADSIEQGSYLRTLVPAHPFIAAHVLGPSSFATTLERVEALGDDELERVVALVPDAWGLTGEERSCLVDFLTTRRGLLRGVLASNRSAFPNWKD